MSYRRESPCMKYYEKAKGDGLIRKSLSATRFPPIRRTSDPSSDDSDDFHQLDIGEDQSSSISRSSSESCHSLGSNRCQLRKLEEIQMRSSRSSLNKMQIFDDDFHHKNESLDEFRSRLRIRRSIKARDQDWNTYQENEGDRSDFSCDSTTKEAHEEILRNAESLRLEQAENFNMSSKKLNRTYKPLTQRTKVEKRIDFADNHTIKDEEDFDKILESNDGLETKEETLERLCHRRQEELRLATLPKRSSLDYSEEGAMHGLQRSSTDYFGQIVSDDSPNKSLSNRAKKIFSSPRLRRKTQSQMLRAASSIPSLIFPLKSNKTKSVHTNDCSALDSSHSNTPDSFAGSKKSSIDEGLMCTTPKTRRSPLRFLGNFVDDKILKGRWGSTKRAKSSVDLGRLAWEIPDDLTDNSNAEKQKLNRRKSNKEDNQKTIIKDVTQIARRPASTDTVDNSVNSTPKTSTSSILKRKPRSLSTCVSVRNRIPSATSDRLSLSSSSAIGSDDATDIFLTQSPLRTEISADALAEIEAFERLAQSLLYESPSDK